MADETVDGVGEISIGRLIDAMQRGKAVVVEPSADIRAAAKSLRELYVALLEEGFTMVEAMVLAAMSRGGAP